ncbi:glycosyltransferase [Candidatus Parcubacteria bacterium]|nr:glycosyltransferase [Candidatus Parcubacteria bacterium]
MSKPLISVVIPVYNEEKRIRRAIESIQKQTYPNLEIIVVDDGSTDGTPGVVKAIAAQDSRVSYYENPKVPARTNWRGYDINAGWAARAYGFRLAKGEWITTQDADDASLLNRIEVEYDLAQKYQATMVTVFWMPVGDKTIGKKLNVEQIIQEKGEESFVVRPETINRLVQECYGLLMHLPFHRFIPFSIKWFPYTRNLFWGKRHDYPGADPSVMFDRKVIDAGINVRARNARTFGVPSGRGSGRDFVMQTALTFKNNWSFRLPLYLLSSNREYPDFVGYDKYLI